MEVEKLNEASPDSKDSSFSNNGAVRRSRAPSNESPLALTRRLGSRELRHTRSLLGTAQGPQTHGCRWPHRVQPDTTCALFEDRAQQGLAEVRRRRDRVRIAQKRTLRLF